MCVRERERERERERQSGRPRQQQEKVKGLVPKAKKETTTTTATTHPSLEDDGQRRVVVGPEAVLGVDELFFLTRFEVE